MPVGTRIGSKVGARIGATIGTTPLGTSTGLVVVAGQSNADHKGDVDNVTIELGLGSAYSAVQEISHASTGFTDPIVWVDDGPESLQPRTAGGAMGVHLSLGRRLNEARPNSWAMLTVAVDSTSIDVHWDPDAGAPAPDNLFEQFLAYVATAKTTLAAPRIAALVWIQGEGDAANEARSLAYLANLTELITDFRAANPGVLLIFNRLHADCTQTYTTNVRAAQEQYVLDDPLSTMINVDDLVLTDGLHFDSDSFVTFGNRVATHILGTATLSAITTLPDGPSYATDFSPQQFYARGEYSDGSRKNLSALASWQSSDTNVATVSATGLVTPVGAGTCNITATVNGLSDASAVTITAPPAAPTVVGVGPAASGVANQTPAWPSHVAGDWAYLAVEATAAVAVPAGGWAEAANSPQLQSTNTRIHVFEKKAASGSESAPTVLLGTSNHLHCVITTVRGADGTAPDEATAGAVSGGTGLTTVTLPAVTTLDVNRRILLFSSWSIDNAGPIASLAVNANLTSITEHYDGGTTLGNGGGLIIASGVKQSAGSTSTTTIAVSPAILYGCLTVAVKPA